MSELKIPDELRELYEEQELDDALHRRVRFLVQGGPVVMASENDALKAQLAEAKAGWDSSISDLRTAAEICRGVEAERDSLRAQLARANGLIAQAHNDFAAFLDVSRRTEKARSQSRTGLSTALAILRGLLSSLDLPP